MGVYERVVVDFFLIIRLKASGNTKEKGGGAERHLVLIEKALFTLSPDKPTLLACVVFSTLCVSAAKYSEDYGTEICSKTC
jgi:hypothetical protein